MSITGVNSLYDSLTIYYLISVLTTIFALIGTYFVCYRLKVQKSESVTKESSNIEGEEGNPSDKTSTVKSSLEAEKPAHAAELVINASLTEEQKKEEIETQKQQLEEIFKLMQEQSDKFGMTTMSDIEEQMKLYR